MRALAPASSSKIAKAVFGPWSSSRSSFRWVVMLLTLPAGLATLAVRPAAGRGCPPAFSSGGDQSLAVKSDHTVWAWGQNTWGQLGDGTNQGSNTPVQVKDSSGIGVLSGVVAVAAGDGHSLALKGDTSVWAWGQGGWGELGNGDIANSNLPVAVKSPSGSGVLSNVVTLSAGHGHTLALMPDGTVLAWGLNSEGQLGDGTNTNASLPVQVKDPSGAAVLSGITAISAGHVHSFALRNDGTLWAWGGNAEGELGDGTLVNSPLPVQVKDQSGTGFLSGVASMAAGFFQSVVLLFDGTLLAWGWNAEGQLGNGTFSGTPSTLPAPVLDASGTAPLAGVIAISGSGFCTLALRNDGTLWAWGKNSYGWLGDGTTNHASLPVRVKDTIGTGFLDGAAMIGTGYNQSLAAMSDGTLWIWGQNNFGQLGDGTNNNSSLPVRTLINLGSRMPDPIPVDQGNVLRARKNGADVIVTFPLASAALCRVYRDADRQSIGSTALLPDAGTGVYGDLGAVAVAANYYYSVKGLSPCSYTPGP